MHILLVINWKPVLTVWPYNPQQKTALPRVLPWFAELLARGASTEERDPTRAMDVPFGMRAGIVTALAGVTDADDPSGTVCAPFACDYLPARCDLSRLGQQS